MANLDDSGMSAFSVEVGGRLRAVRRSLRLSLDDVEKKSGGQWSASAVGAYERGFRNLSLPRLRELAAFYDVPMSRLLGEADDGHRPPHPIVVDLARLAVVDDATAEALLRYVRSLVAQRNGGSEAAATASVRADDVKLLCALLETDESELVERLNGWGALVTAR